MKCCIALTALLLISFSGAAFAEEPSVAPAPPAINTPSTPAEPDLPVAAVPVPTKPARMEIRVRQMMPIEFGSFASEAAGGSITVTPSGGRMRSGNVTPMGAGFAGSADFEIIGQPGEMVIIYLPDRVNLGKNGGNGNAIITHFTVSPGDTLQLDAQGRARVKVGGTLQVPGNVAPGAYSGMFDIDVRYLH